MTTTEDPTDDSNPEELVDESRAEESTEDANPDEPTDDFDPLAYEPGDRVGLCLDVDGTVYRSGSIFIETLAFLPYAEGVTLTPDERRHRRTALTAVAEYHGGTVAKTKWRAVMASLDALRVAGPEYLSERLLTTLARRSVDRQSSRDAGSPSSGASDSGVDSYRTMRETILSAYGSLLRGKRRTDVTNAVAEIVDSRCRVEPRLRETLDRLARRTDTDLYLVTDAPEHVGAAYARKLGDDVRVIGTAYDTDATGRYTGTFERVDKDATVARLRADHDWQYVVAAGDSAVDVAMADEANLFMAVAGEGDVDCWLDGGDAISVPRSEREARERLGPGRGLIRVSRNEDFAAALRTTLDAVDVPSSVASSD